MRMKYLSSICDTYPTTVTYTTDVVALCCSGRTGVQIMQAFVNRNSENGPGVVRIQEAIRSLKLEYKNISVKIELRSGKQICMEVNVAMSIQQMLVTLTFTNPGTNVFTRSFRFK